MHIVSLTNRRKIVNLLEELLQRELNVNHCICVQKKIYISPSSDARQTIISFPSDATIYRNAGGSFVVSARLLTPEGIRTLFACIKTIFQRDSGNFAGVFFRRVSVRSVTSANNGALQAQGHNSSREHDAPC